jgi:uncharacterized membrane protein YoaK (UPF0700 family)
MILIALALGSTNRIIRLTAIPLLEGERDTARLFSLPPFIVIVTAATALDRVLKQSVTASWHRLLAIVALGFASLDIAANIRVWRVAVSSGLFGSAPFTPGLGAVIERADPVYAK